MIICLSLTYILFFAQNKIFQIYAVVYWVNGLRIRDLRKKLKIPKFCTCSDDIYRFDVFVVYVIVICFSSLQIPNWLIREEHNNEKYLMKF